MKKAVIKYLLAAVLAVVGSQAAFSQYYTVNAIPMCWRTPGGVDSTIYESQLDASQYTKPARKYYFNAQGNAVTVTGGILRFGGCESPQTDSILVRLNVLVNDTASVVNELGCLTLYDTAGCGVVGLYTGLDGITPGWNNVWLNGNYLFASSLNTCEFLAYGLNASVYSHIPGTWSCCNDSLVVASLDTSLFWRLDFVSTITGDTVTHFFDDTTGTDVTTSIIPVEVIKLVDRFGNITSLRYFSADGATEYTGQGNLALGPCQTPEETIFQEYVTNTVNNVNNYLGDCNTLANEWRLETILANTTYNANTFNSIAITAISGTVTVNTDGAGAVTINPGDVYTIRANACSYVQTSVAVGVTSGSANISRFY